jgi:hypothetical protein
VTYNEKCSNGRVYNNCSCVEPADELIITTGSDNADIEFTKPIETVKQMPTTEVSKVREEPLCQSNGETINGMAIKALNEIATIQARLIELKRVVASLIALSNETVEGSKTASKEETVSKTMVAMTKEATNDITQGGG